MEITSREFAERIGVCPATVYNWEARGFIVPVRYTPSGRRFYSIEQVEAYKRGDFDSLARKPNGVSNVKGGTWDGGGYDRGMQSS